VRDALHDGGISPHAQRVAPHDAGDVECHPDRRMLDGDLSQRLRGRSRATVKSLDHGGSAQGWEEDVKLNFNTALGRIGRKCGGNGRKCGKASRAGPSSRSFIFKYQLNCWIWRIKRLMLIMRLISTFRSIFAFRLMYSSCHHINCVLRFFAHIFRH